MERRGSDGGERVMEGGVREGGMGWRGEGGDGGMERGGRGCRDGEGRAQRLKNKVFT